MSENTDPYVVLANWLTPPAMLGTNDLGYMPYNQVILQGRNHEIAMLAAKIRVGRPEDRIEVGTIQLHALAIRLAALERAARK